MVDNETGRTYTFKGARMRAIGGHCILLKGSRIVSRISSGVTSRTNGIAAIVRHINEAQANAANNVLIRDVYYDSPSAAAHAASGSPAKGWNSWSLV
ncbi:hypothetical protein FACS1894125_2300 [Actinomycetota bacterium]|nr:hypothetical protein FACS1894125_2300 [Actinomycetota bacterium]